METWMLALILGGVIAVVVVISDSDTETTGKNSRYSRGIRVFVVSVAVIYLGITYLGGDAGVKHEINTGEPPF